jgi:hypothetical protein
MYSLRDKYAISGIGWTEFSKKSGRTVRSLASEACLKAIDDSGLKVADIDGFVSFNFNDSVPAISVATEIGVPAARYANDFLSGGNAANMIVLTAAAVIEAGLAENVLCYRAMNGRSGFRLGGGREMAAQGITQFTAPFGWITYPQAMAMWCRRHMIEYGTTADQLGDIAVTFRSNAIDNPRAMQRDPITKDDYMNSRMIVDPFRMLDICLETDGACAVLVTKAERARDLKRKPVYIAGGAYGGGPDQGEDLFDAIRWPDHSHNYAKYIADDLWRSAGGHRHCRDLRLLHLQRHHAARRPEVLQGRRGRLLHPGRSHRPRRRASAQHPRRPLVGGLHSWAQSRHRGGAAAAR